MFSASANMHCRAREPKNGPDPSKVNQYQNPLVLNSSACFRAPRQRRQAERGFGPGGAGTRLLTIV